MALLVLFFLRMQHAAHLSAWRNHTIHDQNKMPLCLFSLSMFTKSSSCAFTKIVGPRVCVTPLSSAQNAAREASRASRTAPLFLASFQICGCVSVPSHHSTYDAFPHMPGNLGFSDRGDKSFQQLVRRVPIAIHHIVPSGDAYIHSTYIHTYIHTHLHAHAHTHTHTHTH